MTTVHHGSTQLHLVELPTWPILVVVLVAVLLAIVVIARHGRGR